MKMTFYAWLGKQIKRDDPVGDLARDARYPSADKPRRHTLTTWLNYLYKYNACDKAIEALRVAWGEYSKRYEVRYQIEVNKKGIK
jgi:hypothetical protein